jgi:hypothetical protein
MVALDAPSKRQAVSDEDADGDLEPESFEDGPENGKELSLERLQEEESADDPSEMDYGDGDE